MLQTLVEDLNEESGRPGPSEQQEVPAAGESGQTEREPVSGDGDTVIEEAIRGSIQALQEAFGPRIERILGAGGGLLVVMDRVDEEADRMARQVSGEIPVALIDPRTLGGLQRLGAASPVGESRTYYDAAPAGGAQKKGSRLAVLAREKLKAAEVLIGQQCLVAATELLNSASLAAAAARAELEQPPSPQEAGVWLYGEALPKGWLTQEQAGLVMRAVTLAQAPAVPEPLLQELLGDVRGFVEMAG